MRKTQVKYTLSKIDKDVIKTCKRAYHAMCSLMFHTSVAVYPKPLGHIIGSIVYLKYRFFPSREIDYENKTITYML